MKKKKSSIEMYTSFPLQSLGPDFLFCPLLIDIGTSVCLEYQGPTLARHGL